MALFKVNTGTREQEVCQLRWDWEVPVPELDTSVFVVPGGLVKNKEDRLVVLNDVAKSVIDAQRGVHPFRVFTYRNRLIEGMYNSAWKRARIKAAKPYAREKVNVSPGALPICASTTSSTHLVEGYERLECRWKPGRCC
jgi:hypothetical protein